MTLPGYTIDTYEQLAEIDVTTYKDKTLYFVVNKQNWYYLDKTDNNAWKPCIIDKLNSLPNLTEEFLQREPAANDIFGLVTYSDSPLDNNLPKFQVQSRIIQNQLPIETVTKLAQTDDYITTLFDIADNLGHLVNAVTQRITNLETVTQGEVVIHKIDNINDPHTVFPKLELLTTSGPPTRTLFVVTGFGGPIAIGGTLIVHNSNPIAESFNSDFIGQQWLDTTNNELWIAMGNNIESGWRKVALNPPVLNLNSPSNR